MAPWFALRTAMGNAAMNGRGKSDGLVVPRKRPNKDGGAPPEAEAVEGRGSAKGNAVKRTRFRTQSRADLQQELDRVRQAAKGDRKQRFTALWHHVCNIDRLREAYYSLKRDSAAGVDGETWREYGEELEQRLTGLSGRLMRGAYRAKPVRRVYIAKEDGRQRPIGVTTLEDKIVQRTTTEVLNAIYEADFIGYSYGFRPGRSQHDALDALTVGIERRKVNWVLDADVRGFFDAIVHEWLVKFVEHRIADKRVVRHIKKWLNAGVLEDGEVHRAKEGTPQGGCISPLLANIYLHYALDLWVRSWRRRHASGDVIFVRYADDFVVGFERREEAERFLAELCERLRRFGLELHPTKTRLIEFGRYAVERRQRRGKGKPETFTFLGFTHICGRTRRGRFKVLRQTKGKKLRAKLAELKSEIRRRMHWPISKVGEWLKAVLTGHYRYFGVPGNLPALSKFRYEVARLWYRTLRRRSQKTTITWAVMGRLERQWLPLPRVMHAYPNQRLRV
jgi:group II intron reverse transcriptase/maturase